MSKNDKKNKYMRGWRKKNRAKSRASTLKSYYKRQKYYQEKGRKNYSPEKRRAYLLKSKYGMSLQDYEIIYKAQKGKCAICGNPEPKLINPKKDRLVVDHNHKTDKVRGLLCSSCNVVLGYVQDDIELLTKMIAYLNLYDAFE